MKERGFAMEKKRKKHKILLRLFWYLIITVAIFLFFQIFNSIVGYWAFAPRREVKTKTEFSKEEIKLLENELNFSMSNKKELNSDTEKIEYARYFSTRDRTTVQVWISGVKNAKKFIEQNLGLEYKQFEKTVFSEYAKTEEGTILYNEEEFYNKAKEEGKQLINGLKYEDEGTGLYEIKVYQSPSESTATIIIYKEEYHKSDFKNPDIFKMFSM